MTDQQHDPSHDDIDEIVGYDGYGAPIYGWAVPDEDGDLRAWRDVSGAMSLEVQFVDETHFWEISKLITGVDGRPTLAERDIPSRGQE